VSKHAPVKEDLIEGQLKECRKNIFTEKIIGILVLFSLRIKMFSETFEFL